MKIPTFDPATKQENGYVILCWNALEQAEERPDQVYVTAIKPGCHKGPHLHKVRCGRFICIKGNVRIETRHPAADVPAMWSPWLPLVKLTEFSGEQHGHRLIKVEPGVAACIYNDGPAEALVINMPTPAWSKEQPDEWPVEDWDA